MKKSALIATLILGASSVFAMDENGWATTYESMSAFESARGRSGYVKPIIDNLGNVLNSNWYISASVPQSFTFEAGIPLSIIPIGDDDRKYTESVNILGQSIDYELPTIFGDHRDMSPESTDPANVIYGSKTLNGLGVFSYPYLQLGAGFYHARLVFRGMVLPSISELRKFNLFGFGLQYSFGHLFQYMLPPAAQPLDVSLVFGYNSSTIGYRPEDYDGELDLDVSTTNFSLVIGYKPFDFFEVMMSLGYQSAEMLSYGGLICTAKEYGLPTADYGKEITPDITVKGNNGFRFSLAVAFQLGKAFHPVVGFDYAGKTSFTTNVLYFRQQFGEDPSPADIAKQKGSTQNAQPQPNSTETSPKPAAESSSDSWSGAENPEEDWNTNTDAEMMNDSAEPAEEQTSDSEDF